MAIRNYGLVALCMNGIKVMRTCLGHKENMSCYTSIAEKNLVHGNPPWSRRMQGFHVIMYFFKFRVGEREDWRRRRIPETFVPEECDRTTG